MSNACDDLVSFVVVVNFPPQNLQYQDAFFMYTNQSWLYCQCVFQCLTHLFLPLKHFLSVRNTQDVVVCGRGRDSLCHRAP